MPHSFGYRAATRTLFKKAFKTNGRCPTTTYLRTFKRGDYVDIKVDSSIHKGMPFKHYHGRTGVVFNVTKRAVGVRVNKQVKKIVFFSRNGDDDHDWYGDDIWDAGQKLNGKRCTNRVRMDDLLGQGGF